MNRKNSTFDKDGTQCNLSGMDNKEHYYFEGEGDYYEDEGDFFDTVGFGPRLIAEILDRVILFVLLMLVFMPLYLRIEMSLKEYLEDFDGTTAFILVTILGIPLIILLYRTFCESSRYQATPGKKIMNIKVVDYRGERLTFIRALIRNFSKLFSTLILYIGFFMITWTADEQGLHDIIAGTLVVNADME